MAYQRKFSPTKYWANKPYCVICKDKKVKRGQFCGDCEKKAGFDEKQMEISADDINKNDLLLPAESTEIERDAAPKEVISLVGYLKDCAQALLRSVALTDLSSNDISFLPVDPDALEQLADGSLKLRGKEVLDLLYKVTARPTEFEIIFGTLFVKGYRGSGNKLSKINAPLLFVKLEVEKAEDDSVIFTVKEDTIHINQSLIASIVSVENEEELEIRFQDLYGATPEWPLNLDSTKRFFESFNNYFPGIVHANEEVLKFIKFESIDATKGHYSLCPAHCIIVTPKQDAEGTVVEELNQILKGMQNHTAADLLFAGGHSETNLGSGPTGDTTEIFSSAVTEDWHNLFPFDLSDTQKKIVLGARMNNLTVVSGPPGTGKSYTISAVILDHLLQGKRVLFVSRMDKAVDVVSGWLQEFVGPYAIARSGARKAQRMLAEKLDNITGPTSPVRPTSKKYITGVFDNYKEVQDKLNTFEVQFTELLTNERNWGEIKYKIDRLNKQIQGDYDFSKLNHSEERAIKLKEKIKGADFLQKNKGFFIKTWWGNFTINNIRKSLGAPENTSTDELLLMVEKIENNSKRKSVEKEIEKFEEINQLWSQIQNLKIQLRTLALESLKTKLLGNLHLIVHNYKKRVELRNFIKSLRTANIREKLGLLKKINTETLLASFPCWASTTFHLSQILPVQPGMFDLVIFDEASQCDLASAVPALYRANRVMVVGDPKQLNHVVFLGKQLEYSSFAKNAVPPEMQANYRFSTQSLFDVAENSVPQENYFMLDEHFRSDPHIIDFSNKMFYDEKIRIMTQQPRLNDESDCAIQVEYVKGERTVGAANPKEIKIIFKHVEELMVHSSEGKPVTIGILSPFRDQVDAITKELPKYLTLNQVEKHKIVIGTAHSLQGDEKDVVILSLSLDPVFHHGTLNFLEKPNVFNVSITRAKKKLIVITSVKPEGLPNGLLKEFLIHAKKGPANVIPKNLFDSKFEEQVARALEIEGLKVWPQYQAAGFYIDLVVGDGKNWIAVECDGPRHFDEKGEQQFHDIWRQGILERAGWRFVRITSREWEKDSDSAIGRVKMLLDSFTV